MVSESAEFIRLAGAGTEAIQLRCTMAQFEGLQEAEETQIVPGALGDPGDGQDPKLSAPYYGRGGMGLAMAVGTGLGTGKPAGLEPSRSARWPTSATVFGSV